MNTFSSRGWGEGGPISENNQLNYLSHRWVFLEDFLTKIYAFFLISPNISCIIFLAPISSRIKPEFGYSLSILRKKKMEKKKIRSSNLSSQLEAELWGWLLSMEMRWLLGPGREQACPSLKRDLGFRYICLVPSISLKKVNKFSHWTS